jgi:DNA repair protein RadC
MTLPLYIYKKGVGGSRKDIEALQEPPYPRIEKRKKMHKNTKYWAFTLVGPRVSKKQLLEQFQEIFNNVSGLTLSKTYDSKAAMKYASKIDTRVRGPFYVGQKENYSEEYASMDLRQWQKELFEFIVTNKNNPIIRERKIIWVELAAQASLSSKNGLD